MVNALFLLDNQADTGTISASSTAGGTMPASNLLNEQRSQVWRSGAGTSSSVALTLGSIAGANYAALVDVNLSTAGTIRVQSWADAVGGAVPGIDVTVPASLYVSQDLVATAYGMGPYGVGPYGTNGVLTQNGGRNVTLIPFGAVTLHPYFRFTFSDGNTSYQQCGRVVVARATSFSYNLSYGWDGDRAERTVNRESIGGQSYRQQRDSRQRLGGSFDWLTDDERTEMFIRLQQFGQSKAFIYSIFPEATNRGLTTTVYGRFDSAKVGGRGYQQNNLTFSVIEEL